MDLKGWMTDHRGRFDAWLGEQFEQVWPEAFRERLVYPVFSGGKRVRPLVSIAAFEAVAGTEVEANSVYPAAGAVELIHTYSLVHDDMPCMDNDDLRRGRPTVHRVWDEATAVLVGDALQSQAFGMLASAPWTGERIKQAVQILAQDSGTWGMVGGQAADIGVQGPVLDLETLTRLHSLKTGALIRAAAVLGGLAAGGADEHLGALDLYGRQIGLAFQLADDVLDADEDAGEDGPPSYVKLLGVDETRRRAEAAATEAIEAVQHLQAPQALIALARFIVERDH